MKENSLKSSKIRNWLQKNTEGTMLMQWISYFMIFSVLVIFIITYPVNEKIDWRFFATVIILAILLLTNIFWFQSEDHLIFRNHEILWLWFINIFTEILVLVAFAITGRGEIVFLMFMQVAQFASTLGVWPGGAAYCLINIGAALGILKAYDVSNEQLIQFGAQFMAGMIFVLVLILLVRRSETERSRAEGLYKELQAAHIDLKAAQQKEKELAIAEERMRMARDIHDGLGHHLTVLSIQLQAADKLVERNPQAAAEALRISRTEVQAALDEVRLSVGVMRQSPAESQPLGFMLAKLVEDFSEHTGLESHFEQNGNPVELSAIAGQTLFRAVQESLTNVQKHGQGVKHIQVKLEYSAEHVRLAVNDDGRKPDPATTGQAGYGLKGLQERVDQLGGSFCCGPGSESGFQVDITIPLHEVIHDQSSPGG
jgi:signal transduction histidine kinase